MQRSSPQRTHSEAAAIGATANYASAASPIKWRYLAYAAGVSRSANCRWISKDSPNGSRPGHLLAGHLIGRYLSTSHDVFLYFHRIQGGR
eukprot:scaffold3900_cov258-Pinguiococcus_pyrenoidosus.AAC.3